ncbi:hypothetical protein [Bacteroides sp.]|uniref:hypothetical protein n=1 Tax=Bacteroides sp. TaxID=29523 RepID=UPI00261FAC13|nr:hypothetical protein [Bacteroides sp.]MDD3040411.1 hypothetical protein [Bacteroides sp.]
MAKIRIKMTCVSEYEPIPECYPPDSTLEEMAQIDARCAEDYPGEFYNNCAQSQVSYEILTEELIQYQSCMALIADAYRRMGTNRDPVYRVKQIAFCEKQLEKITEIIEKEKINKF